MIFVFGSNLLGIHGAGAAKFAYQRRGARNGIGEGLAGDSYALPTCSKPGEPLSLNQIEQHVEFFLRFARDNPELQFQVTRVGCGYAGYTPEQIAPLFYDAPDNVWLPASFARAMKKPLPEELQNENV